MYLNDFKRELAQALGEPVTVTAFRDAADVSFPCAVILDDESTHGGDGKLFYKMHAVSIEHYTETNDGGEHDALEAYLLAKQITYTKTTTYIKDERFFMTVYDFDEEIVEKLKEDYHV